MIYNTRIRCKNDLLNRLVEMCDSKVVGMERRSKRSTQTLTLESQFTRITSIFHGNGVLSSKCVKIHSDPNIFTVNNFLTKNELLWLNRICTNHKKSFKTSHTESDTNERVLSEERTSTFFHLAKSQDALTRQIECRAADLLGVPSDLVEPLQIVSYTSGQQFTLHHDAGTLMETTGEVCLVYPRRLVTIFIYLNSLPWGQGHTEFPALGLSVQPQQGSAVMFCNVLKDGQVDARLVHQACPVEGTLRKYGMNVHTTPLHYSTLTTLYYTMLHLHVHCSA